MSKVSAPAKVHLIGEHAVVYGYPAIIASVGRRIYIEAKQSDSVVFRDERFRMSGAWKLDSVIRAFEESQELLAKCTAQSDFTDLFSWTKKSDNFWKALIGTVLDGMQADGGISIHISRSDIPTGSGLGSSSAAAVAISKAASEACGRKMTLDEINEIAFKCERLSHGNPSGGDNAASCFGGLVWFQKNTPKNTIKAIHQDRYDDLEKFVFVYTKRPKKTAGELIQMVRIIPENRRKPAMENLSNMAYEMLDSMEKRDSERMMSIINKTNAILDSFGLSTPHTKKICEKVVSLGGAAKMCGACGGGTVLAWHEEPEKIISAIKEMGFDPFQANIAVEGVRAER